MELHGHGSITAEGEVIKPVIYFLCVCKFQWKYRLKKKKNKQELNSINFCSEIAKKISSRYDFYMTWYTKGETTPIKKEVESNPPMLAFYLWKQIKRVWPK